MNVPMVKGVATKIIMCLSDPAGLDVYQVAEPAEYGRPSLLLSRQQTERQPSSLAVAFVRGAACSAIRVAKICVG